MTRIYGFIALVAVSALALGVEAQFGGTTNIGPGDGVLLVNWVDQPVHWTLYNSGIWPAVAKVTYTNQDTSRGAAQDLHAREYSWHNSLAMA